MKFLAKIRRTVTHRGLGSTATLLRERRLEGGEMVELGPLFLPWADRSRPGSPRIEWWLRSLELPPVSALPSAFSAETSSMFVDFFSTATTVRRRVVVAGFAVIDTVEADI